jgi:hypothetical protein
MWHPREETTACLGAQFQPIYWPFIVNIEIGLSSQWSEFGARPVSTLIDRFSPLYGAAGPLFALASGPLIGI